MKRKLSNL